MTGWKKRKIADAQNDIHSCGPFCDNPICVAVRNAVKAEREACAKYLDEQNTAMTDKFAAAIRARGNT